VPRDRLFRRRVLPVAFSVLAVVILAAGGYAGWKLLSPTPPPAVRLDLASTMALDPGVPPPIPVPAQGSFDLVSSDGGRLAASGADTPVAIGSIAKVMVALVALQRLPLSPGQAGPTYTITAQDVRIYRRYVAENGSTLFVAVGEQFSEREMLLGLLLPSADNLADTLGAWAAGSDSSFLADMNVEAQDLGMTRTHFADLSGISPQTVSSAADLVTLGQAALSNPVLASLVATPSAVMPDGTTVRNLDSDLQTVPGWLGIKTGSTPAAGGCLLFAAQHPAPFGSAQAQVTVVGALLGQPLTGGDFGLGPVLDGAAAAVRAAFAAYDSVNLADLAAPSLPGRVVAPWGGSAALRATLSSSRPPVVVRKGTSLHLTGRPLNHLPSADAVTDGTVVARVVGSLDGRTLATWTVTSTGDLGQPTWEWLLTH
jgi:D-alanyl-D-alanine carboxypeptidase (penicillin-binding protein 5/6)